MTTGLSLGAALGLCLGGSLLLLWYALLPPRVSLARQLAKFERANQAGSFDSAHPRLMGWLARAGIGPGQLTSDLRLVDKTWEAHILEKVVRAVFGFLLPTATAAVVAVFGVGVPWLGTTIAAVAMAALFFWAPNLRVRRDAEARRSELRRTLACYLDLVSMSVEGSRGWPEALPLAAKVGQGWGFQLLQDTLDRARRTGQQPFTALGELGVNTRVSELEDLGAALVLVADDGAKIRASLTARAKSQRQRQLAEAIGRAEAGDQQMQIAQVLLAIAFLVFLMYPALVAVLGA